MIQTPNKMIYFFASIMYCIIIYNYWYLKNNNAELTRLMVIMVLKQLFSISKLVISVCMLNLFIVLYDTGLFCLYDMCTLKWIHMLSYPINFNLARQHRVFITWSKLWSTSQRHTVSQSTAISFIWILFE